MSPDRRPLVALPEPERVAKLAAMGLGPDHLPATLSPEERKAATMPDPTTPAPIVPSTGFASSEGKLTLAAMVIGFLLEGLAIPLLERLPHATWAVIALAACGVVLQVAVLFGYQKGRTALKLAAMAPPKPQ